MIRSSIAELEQAEGYLSNPYFQPSNAIPTSSNTQLDKKVNALIQTRHQELQEGRLESQNKQFISTFKAITDQFYFIFKTSRDIKKISMKLT